MNPTPIIKLFAAADKAKGNNAGIEIRITDDLTPGLLDAVGRSVVSKSPTLWERWEENENDMRDGPSGNTYQIAFLEGWYALKGKERMFSYIDVVRIGQDLLKVRSAEEAQAYTRWILLNRKSPSLNTYRTQTNTRKEDK